VRKVKIITSSIFLDRGMFSMSLIAIHSPRFLGIGILRKYRSLHFDFL